MMGIYSDRDGAKHLGIDDMQYVVRDILDLVLEVEKYWPKHKCSTIS